MAKKFGKFLLFTAAVGSAAAAAYYYLQKKGISTESTEEEDCEDFSEDLDDAEPSKSYVPLNPASGSQEEKKEEGFVPLDKVAPAADQESAASESSAPDGKPEIEEFFNEETNAE